MSRRASRWWSTVAGAVLAAAFLGPGTVTTAARAGAAHGTSLLWTLLLATIACFVLQDASARLTIGSDLPLAAALRRRHGRWAAGLVGGAVILGCAAYEAGNILGGVAGGSLAFGVGRVPLTIASVVLASALLFFGGTGAVTLVLSLLVAVMGGAFVVTAVGVAPDLSAVVGGLLVPAVPAGAGLLILGLVGTTVVPYNLFLGSGLARGQDGASTRFGLAIAIGLGGLVSMAVLLVGTAVAGPFGFEAVGEVLAARLGPWARTFFGVGLLAAGFTSAVTAPLAAAMTARGLFGGADSEDPRWTPRGSGFRAVWAAVLLVGAVFGLLDVRPVPVIVLAQAANGIVLPLVAVFLFVSTGDRQLLGDEAYGRVGRSVLAVVVLLSVALGIRGLVGALSSVF